MEARFVKDSSQLIAKINKQIIEGTALIGQLQTRDFKWWQELADKLTTETAKAAQQVGTMACISGHRYLPFIAVFAARPLHEARTDIKLLQDVAASIATVGLAAAAPVWQQAEAAHGNLTSTIKLAKQALPKPARSTPAASEPTASEDGGQS